mmetsp:Transcript_126106/g.342374  ORF Transcript_126106/g.342374 Transcript_126106/m.342374 type:complete len:206 (-) Transcript_126106:353-970(-)
MIKDDTNMSRAMRCALTQSWSGMPKHPQRQNQWDRRTPSPTPSSNTSIIHFRMSPASSALYQPTHQTSCSAAPASTTSRSTTMPADIAMGTPRQHGSATAASEAPSPRVRWDLCLSGTARSSLRACASTSGLSSSSSSDSPGAPPSMASCPSASSPSGAAPAWPSSAAASSAAAATGVPRVGRRPRVRAEAPRSILDAAAPPLRR